MNKRFILGVIGSMMALSSTSALATNGFLGHCVGPYKCGTGGAGAAFATSAIDAIVNPALIAQQESNWVADLKMMHAGVHTDSSAAPAGNKAAGRQKSAARVFPDFAGGVSYNWRDNITVGVALAASGGMATHYNQSVITMNTVAVGYDTRAMYRLMHLAPTISWRASEQFSVGIAAILGYSDFKTDSPTTKFTQTAGKNDRQSSWGYGAKLGIVAKPHELVTLGASYATPVKFKKFTKYNDLFLGSIDTPQIIVLGSAWHVMPDLDVLFDVKNIAYGGVKALSKTPAEGGFGWRDQTILMFGITKRYENWSFSGGYNYGRSPVPADKTFANALLPAIAESHFTGGFGYKFRNDAELLWTAYYSPKKTQKDPGTGDNFSVAGKDTKVTMTQYGVGVGVKYNF